MMNAHHRQALTAGYERLCAWADLLNRINVFPVPDADTGTNLLISLSPLRNMDNDTDVAARRLLMIAKGNAGNIAACFFSAFFKNGSFDALADAVRAGRDHAWEAVADPRPGTMLSVFDALMHHLDTCDALPPKETNPQGPNGLIKSLQTAVHMTGDMLPELRAARVVDSGALGMYIFFEAMFASLAGHQDVFQPVTQIFDGKLRISEGYTPQAETGFCVDTVIRTSGSADTARRSLNNLGTSMVVRKEMDTLKIHLHTQDRTQLRSALEHLGTVEQWSDQSMADQVQGQWGKARQTPLHIITDAAGSVTRQDAFDLGMTLLDSYIVMPDSHLPETLVNPGNLYSVMKKGHRVTTAQASVFERQQYYQSVLEQYQRVLYLCVGSAYTGNYDTVTAWQRQHDPGNRLTIIDTGAASGRLGIMALAAARFNATAKTAEEVIKHTRNLTRSAREYIFLDKLKYLVAGGRLSRSKGFFGDLLSMKPIITPNASGAEKAGTVRTRNDQVRFALGKLATDLTRETRSMIMLEYSDNRSWIEQQVLPLVRHRFPGADIIFQPLSLTSGVHMGPGTWGIAYLPDNITKPTSQSDNIT